MIYLLWRLLAIWLKKNFWCRHLRTIERAHGLEDILIAGVLSGNMTKDQYAEIVRSTKHCADCGKELP